MDKFHIGATDFVSKNVYILDDKEEVVAIVKPHADQRDHAKLIVAAPDLLTACRAIINNWEHGDLAAAARQCQETVNKYEKGSISDGY
jgi:hypothetical protein